MNGTMILNDSQSHPPLHWWNYAVLLLPGLYIVGGVLLWAGVLFPAMPEETHLREIMALVLILFGVYRGFHYGFKIYRMRRGYGAGGEDE